MYLFEVEPGLDLAQYGVVDALLVPQPEHGGPLAVQQCRTEVGVLLIAPDRRVAVIAGAQDPNSSRAWCTSEWQTPQKAMSMRTSSGPTAARSNSSGARGLFASWVA